MLIYQIGTGISSQVLLSSIYIYVLYMFSWMTLSRLPGGKEMYLCKRRLGGESRSASDQWGCHQQQEHGTLTLHPLPLELPVEKKKKTKYHSWLPWKRSGWTFKREAMSESVLQRYENKSSENLRGYGICEDFDWFHERICMISWFLRTGRQY